MTTQLFQQLQKNLLNSYMDCRFVHSDGDDKPPEFLAKKLYQLSPPEDLALATSLLRPVCLFDSEMSTSKQKYSLVRRVFVVCEEDYAMNKEIEVLMQCKIWTRTS